MKVNLKMFFVIFYPLALLLLIDFTTKYLPISFYTGLPIGGILGAGAVIWWRMAKTFLYASDIRIEKE